uniref:Uncharacterized protein n=1 Tax=Tetranychus urticae TaxID=32264 RepID=T1KR47_TETUR
MLEGLIMVLLNLLQGTGTLAAFRGEVILKYSESTLIFTKNQLHLLYYLSLLSTVGSIVDGAYCFITLDVLRPEFRQNRIQPDNQPVVNLSDESADADTRVENDDAQFIDKNE